MYKSIRCYAGICFLLITAGTALCSGHTGPIIGQTEKKYTLADKNRDVQGIAFDDISPLAPRVFVLDRSGIIFSYQLNQNLDNGTDELKLLDQYPLPSDTDKTKLMGPRGLSFVRENGQDIFYFLNWEKSGGNVRSQLWRGNFTEQNFTSIDLTNYWYRIGQREVMDLATDQEKIYLCFDASGYIDHNVRVLRGIIQYQWKPDSKEKLVFIKHMPDTGEYLSQGLAFMTLEEGRYLWGTAGYESIYLAEARTGRGIFYFDRPRTNDSNQKCRGMTFGRNSLWIPVSVSGADHIYRVNVTQNLDMAYEGPRILRHLTMKIQTEPESNIKNPGKVYHYYSRPYAYEQLFNQGVWPETEKIMDLTGAPNATIRKQTYDPGNDAASRQYLGLVEYADAPARNYSSQYEIDLWTNPYRKYVYPHRVDKNLTALAGSNYLADDAELYNLSDTKTYQSFTERVEKHIEDKYCVSADMNHPYWAVRNALEYILDHYYYPGPDERIPATVDYDRNHFDANPGNLKLALSERPYDKTQITACSGTSVMLAGAMRHLQHPARWLGTGVEKDPSQWDVNHNGLLDKTESAPCSNGHRYTQVWLGSHYGWTCFDATPIRPESKDYDPVPPLQSQWRYMNRAARGHLLDKRIVFNVGSQLIRPLYREFEYDAKLAENNNCGGDQRYNLQGRYDMPDLWKLPRHYITEQNLCFIDNIKLSGPQKKTKVVWKNTGDWYRDPEAKLSLYLQQVSADNDKTSTIGKLAEAIPYNAPEIFIDLSAFNGKRFRILISKDGDSETGGLSELFDLE